MEILSFAGLSKILLNLILVIGSMVAFVFLLKRLRWINNPHPRISSKSTLHIVESLGLDLKRRLVVVEWAGEDHLILLGQQGEIVIKSVPSQQSLHDNRLQDKLPNSSHQYAYPS
jgi:flagellar biogenesis protein FliO